MLPALDEVEVSVFGPGHGESVVVHLGRGEWMIVDSCLDRDTGRPAVIQYLTELGVVPEQAVKLVVATHWHDDHVRGLGEVVGRCEASRFVCSGALRANEVIDLAFSYRRRALMQSTGIDELTRVLDVLRRRRLGGSVNAGPVFAQADMPLFQRRINNDLCEAEVHALSPSSASLALAQARLIQLLPQFAEPKLRLAPLEPNDCSVALWLRVGDVRVLLGADLEERDDPNMGWQAVLNSPVRPTGRASAKKVSHHGSANGDHSAVWNELLEPNLPAVTTPFVRGNVRLPSDQDIERLVGRTNRVYLTAPVREAKPFRRPGLVDKMIKSFAPSLRPIDSRQGHVRLRRTFGQNKDAEWRIELFGDALHLNAEAAA